ncbi:MAG TPA: hypothetical protein PK446_02850, partial [Methanomassiliicoccaceae archaeon]|nr:hypothetical protein [Methanomassiliicoccaceae archaeon]
MIDLQHALEERIASIMEDESELVASPEMMDDWCVIQYHDNSGNLVRCEFLETERSWKNRDAVQDYNDLIDQGVEVIVIVPEVVLSSMDEHLAMFAHPDIQLSSMEEAGLTVREVML